MRSIARVPTVQRSKRPSLQLSSMWSASATRVLCGWTVVSAPDTHTECVASHTCCTLVSLPTCCYSVEAQSCPNPRKRGRGARLACSLFKEREQSHRTALKSFGSCTKCKGSTSRRAQTQPKSAGPKLWSTLGRPSHEGRRCASFGPLLASCPARPSASASSFVWLSPSGRAQRAWDDGNVRVPVQ